MIERERRWCPFCGARLTLTQRTPSAYVVQCGDNACRACGPERDGIAEAVYAWERRYYPPDSSESTKDSHGLKCIFYTEFNGQKFVPLDNVLRLIGGSRHD